VGKRTHYEPGTFCWTDLATTDPEEAKAFYGGPVRLGGGGHARRGGGTYTMLMSDGDEVCALYEMEPERRALGHPEPLALARQRGRRRRDRSEG
jgi:predicted enzyme related to lactoylglutathione lyase